jgi:glycosyltransferase involved in cell wall biosynthesis
VGPPVAINARAAVRAEIGGVERLAREMAARLPAMWPDRYRVIRPSRLLAHRLGHLWEQGALPHASRDAELLYSPANLAPIASQRNVVVIHDVAALRLPESYTRGYVAYQRLLLPRLARRAQRVLTVSRFSKEELVGVLGVAPERVRVVPNGVDDRFSPDADAAAARARDGLERPYALLVGTLVGRKNAAVLAAAKDRLRAEGVQLVTAGSGRRYMRGDDRPPVRALGYVPERLLPGLYAGAVLVVLPSLYEGFGLPCLEAMASGTPVVAADRAALPETCGDAALLVDPADPLAVAEAVHTATTDKALRARLRAAGLARASRFTWTRTAELTDAAISELL